MALQLVKSLSVENFGEFNECTDKEFSHTLFVLHEREAMSGKTPYPGSSNIRKFASTDKEFTRTNLILIA